MNSAAARRLERQAISFYSTPSHTPITPIDALPLPALPAPDLRPEIDDPRPVRCFRRLFDIIGATLGLILSTPVMGVIALLIKLQDGGPVFYNATRLGLLGEPFTCYKFRTMVPGADRIRGYLEHLNERRGPFFKITDDPRVTRLGRFLRRYSLDELPQFVNVLRGEMHLVGPRPHPMADVCRYEPRHFQRLLVKPGLTSLWAVEARNDPDFERNLALDLEYIRHRSLRLDLRILLRTIPTVLSGNGQ